MTVRLDRRRPVESNIQKWNRLGEEMLSKPMTALEVVDELTYRNYAERKKAA